MGFKNYLLRYSQYSIAIILSIALIPEIAIASSNKNSFDSQDGAKITTNLTSVQLIAQETALTYYRQGAKYYAREEWELALDNFNKAIELNPNYVNAYIYRGLIYGKLEQRDLSLADYNKSHRLVL